MWSSGPAEVAVWCLVLGCGHREQAWIWRNPRVSQSKALFLFNPCHLLTLWWLVSCVQNSEASVYRSSCLGGHRTLKQHTNKYWPQKSSEIHHRQWGWWDSRHVFRIQPCKTLVSRVDLYWNQQRNILKPMVYRPMPVHIKQNLCRVYNFLKQFSWAIRVKTSWPSVGPYLPWKLSSLNLAGKTNRYRHSSGMSDLEVFTEPLKVVVRFCLQRLGLIRFWVCVNQ